MASSHIYQQVSFSNQWYVSPEGKADGNGSIDNPWDLQTALNHPSQVKPGDIIWLRGGVYRGTFTSKLKGTSEKPIIVREYPGERAILDGNTEEEKKSEVILVVNRGGYVWFWGFEITDSRHETRYVEITGSNPGLKRMPGITVVVPEVKLINLKIHNTLQGISAWDVAIDLDVMET